MSPYPYSEMMRPCMYFPYVIKVFFFYFTVQWITDTIERQWKDYNIYKIRKYFFGNAYLPRLHQLFHNLFYSIHIGEVVECSAVSTKNNYLKNNRCSVCDLVYYCTTSGIHVTPQGIDGSLLWSWRLTTYAVWLSLVSVKAIITVW
jgi:hypothetical protein